MVLGTLLSLALDQLRDQDPGWRQTAQLVQFAGSLVAGLVFIVSWEAR